MARSTWISWRGGRNPSPALPVTERTTDERRSSEGNHQDKGGGPDKNSGPGAGPVRRAFVGGRSCRPDGGRRPPGAAPGPQYQPAGGGLGGRTRGGRGRHPVGRAATGVRQARRRRGRREGDSATVCPG